MNAMVEINSETGLVVLPENDSDVMTLFVGEYDVTIAPLLAHVERAVMAFKASKPDASTETGRKAISSFDYKLARSKTALDNAGKRVNAALKALPVKIDANRRRARELIEGWQIEVSAPLDAWKADEKARTDRHLEAVTALATMGQSTEGRTAEQLRVALASAEAQPVDARCEEFVDEYRLAKTRAVARLGEALAARERYEADQVELAALRAQAAEREARDAADKATREALERFARERRESIDNLKALADVEDVATAGIRKRIERLEAMELLPKVWGDFLGEARLAYDTTLASLRAALKTAERNDAERERLETERQRLEAEAQARREADAAAQREKDEQAARERDQEHRRTVNKGIVDAIMLILGSGAGRTAESAAKAIVSAAVKGGIPNLRVDY